MILEADRPEGLNSMLTNPCSVSRIRQGFFHVVTHCRGGTGGGGVDQ